MSYTNIILHCVWSTYKRTSYLDNKDLRNKLFSHIVSNSRSKGIVIMQIGGYADHIHVLLVLKADQSLSKLIQFIKGESSYWFQKNYNAALKWQDDYYAISVSPSKLKIVTNYIRNQEYHHNKQSFRDEASLFTLYTKCK